MADTRGSDFDGLVIPQAPKLDEMKNAATVQKHLEDNQKFISNLILRIKRLEANVRVLTP
jgi:hypothetical protein